MKNSAWCVSQITNIVLDDAEAVAGGRVGRRMWLAGERRKHAE